MPRDVEIVPADAADPGLRDLVAAHLADMVDTTPDPRSRHALDLDGMFGADVAVWSARLEGRTVGCGALKELGAEAGELKAMRTDPEVRGRGVGGAVLRHLLSVAGDRGYRTVHLETGAQDFFAAARRLYAGHGFVVTGPFGPYAEDPSSVFMRLDLDGSGRGADGASEG